MKDNETVFEDKDGTEVICNIKLYNKIALNEAHLTASDLIDFCVSLFEERGHTELESLHEVRSLVTWRLDQFDEKD